MSGVAVGEAIEIFPDAKRVLLTAYADTEAAIRAINEVGLNHYLMKPWDPPEEHLYPVLTDLLDDWQASFAPPSRGNPRRRPPVVGAVTPSQELGPKPRSISVVGHRDR